MALRSKKREIKRKTNNVLVIKLHFFLSLGMLIKKRVQFDVLSVFHCN